MSQLLQKAMDMWPKIIETVKYRKLLSKSKQPGYSKVDNNTSYDHLVTSIDDLLIPVKIMFFLRVGKETKSILDTVSN